MIDRSNLPLLVTLALGVFAGALDLGVLSPALPALAHTFAIPGREVAWVFTLYLFANVVSIPVMTKLSDVYGRRPIYIACVATFVAGSVLAIAAPTCPSGSSSSFYRARTYRRPPRGRGVRSMLQASLYLHLDCWPS